MRSAANVSTNGSPDRLATVVEAADILGITPDAVRSRLRRGTLKPSPERGEDGEVLVIMPAPRSADQSGDQSETVSDKSIDQSADKSATDRDSSSTVPLVPRTRNGRYAERGMAGTPNEEWPRMTRTAARHGSARIREPAESAVRSPRSAARGPQSAFISF